MKMMREVRLLNENRKTLESYLEAFTFTGGSILIIQVEVETCLDKCKPVIIGFWKKNSIHVNCIVLFDCYYYKLLFSFHCFTHTFSCTGSMSSGQRPQLSRC